MSAQAQPVHSEERAWWLRMLLILQAPRPVFAALRDDSREAAEARQEPILAVVMLAGIAAFLIEPAVGEILDRQEADGLVVAVIVFLGGAASGLIGYWLAAAAVLAGARGAGGEGSYRRARHVLAYSLTPLALSLLVLWPLKLSLYGGDLFRSGGADSGTGGRVLTAAELAFVGWSLLLLAFGLRVTYRLPWLRVPLALAVAAVTAGVLLVLWYAFFHGLGGGG